ncbi:alpha/beta-hydrolase [Xylariaceae sp. FL1019]|nr:alpha/beta-hydrolase [Xylariaceae sp. FL1019]
MLRSMVMAERWEIVSGLNEDLFHDVFDFYALILKSICSYQHFSMLFETLVVSLACLTLGTTAQAEAPVVDLGYAKYQGLRLNAGIDEYLGMRYAQAPVGNLRWRAPQDPLVVDEIQSADEFKAICIGHGQTPSNTTDEDCLYVNVFKPSEANSTSKLPVWLYIQGGGYASNSDYNFNGTEVIQKSGNGIVFVNFNYRVSLYGFLSSERIREDGDLNVGLLDQRKVFEWVRDHISEFGGDPDHVVLHGTSAGAGSVSHHLTAYNGRDDGFFVGAAIQCVFWPRIGTVAEVSYQFDAVASRAGWNRTGDPLSFLRSVPLSSLASADVYDAFPGASSTDPEPLFYFLPVIDGGLIPDYTYNLFANGSFIDVPILIGNMNNEGSNFANNASTSSQVEDLMRNNFPTLTTAQADQIVQEYPLMPPLPEHDIWFPSASAAYGESVFICPGNFIASSVSKYYDANKVWDYRYNVQDADEIAAGLGVPHTFDKSAIFGPGNAGTPPASYLTYNAPIVPIAMSYYISFVLDLDPNPHRDAAAPEWLAWGAGDGERMRLQTNDTAMEVVPQEQTQRCAFWRGISESMEL